MIVDAQISHKIFKSLDNKVQIACTLNSEPRPKNYECVITINSSKDDLETEKIARLSPDDSVRLDALLDLDLEFFSMAQDVKRILSSDHRASIFCAHNYFPRKESIECSVHISRNEV